MKDLGTLLLNFNTPITDNDAQNTLQRINDKDGEAGTKWLSQKSSSGTLEYMRKLLKHLCDKGLIIREKNPLNEYVYKITDIGKEYITDLTI